MKHHSFKAFSSIAIVLFVLVGSNVCVGQTAESLIERAKASIAKKDFPSAISDLSTAIKNEPTNSEALFRRAYAYFLSGEYQKGLADADGSIRLNPASDTTFGLRGMINSKLKNYDAAVLDNTKAIEFNPTKIAWYYNRAVAYERKPSPEWKLAEADLTKAIELGTGQADADTYFNRASAYAHLEDWVSAESDYQRAAQLSPKDASVLIELSGANMKLRHYREAFRNAREAMTLDPKNEAAGKVFVEALGLYGAASPHSDRDLFNAVVNNDLDAVMLALAGGASPNAGQEYNGVKNYTPLLAAASNKDVTITDLLLRAGAKPDAADSNGITAMRLATSYSDVPPAQRAALVSLLIKGGADVNRRDSADGTPLMYACLYAYDEVLEALVKGGADVNAKTSGGGTAMSACSGRASVKGLKILLDAGASATAQPGHAPPIKSAIERNASGIGQVYLLVRAGSDVPTPAASSGEEYKDAYAFAARVNALPRGSMELKLLDAAVDDRGSDLDALLKTIPSLDPVLLNYLLLIAVGNDNGPITSSLISRGADPDFAVGNTTAKTVARFGKKTVAAQYLGPLTTVATTSGDDAEAKMAAALDKTSSGIAAAKRYVAQINDMAKRGVEKGLICVVAGRAKQELLYARQDLLVADKIDLVQYRKNMSEAKDAMESMLRSLNVTGCF